MATETVVLCPHCRKELIGEGPLGLKPFMSETATCRECGATVRLNRTAIIESWGRVALMLSIALPALVLPVITILEGEPGKAVAMIFVGGFGGLFCAILVRPAGMFIGWIVARNVLPDDD